MMSPFAVVPEASSFVVHRQGVVLKTPAGRPYTVPTRALAEALAAEAEGAEAAARAASPHKDPSKIKLDPALMPLARYAATALDVVPVERASLVAQVTAYAGSDLLCHRATHPVELVALQARVWDPYLVWCATRWGCTLKVGAGLMPLVQSAATLRAFHDIIDACDAFRLVGLRGAVDATGSLILGLALADAYQPTATLFEAAELESSYQSAQWGEDPEQTTRRASVRQDMDELARWFALLA